MRWRPPCARRPAPAPARPPATTTTTGVRLMRDRLSPRKLQNPTARRRYIRIFVNEFMSRWPLQWLQLFPAASSVSTRASSRLGSRVAATQPGLFLCRPADSHDREQKVTLIQSAGETLMRDLHAVSKSLHRQPVQRSPLLCAPGLVKFVNAVARLFCFALPRSFLTMFCAE